MSTQPQVPEVDGIDLDFTPRSYFTARDLHVALPSDIMGQARRDMARRLAAEGEDVPPEVLVPVLSAGDRARLGAVHPMLMGGEYLPPLREDEVEIARISLASVTADQISVRARRTGRGIAYSIVDEYADECGDGYAARPRTSQAPLSMRQLVAMLDGACGRGGAVLSPVVANIEYGGSVDDHRDFVTVESDFYPDLGQYYQARLDRWFGENAPEDEEEEE